MNNKTVLMAAMLAIATVLAVGLTVLPSSVQEAQANPCSIEGGETAALTAAISQDDQNSDGEEEADIDVFDCEINGVISEDDD
jgi:hypothetical protein